MNVNFSLTTLSYRKGCYKVKGLYPDCLHGVTPDLLRSITKNRIQLKASLGFNFLPKESKPSLFQKALVRSSENRTTKWQNQVAKIFQEL